MKPFEFFRYLKAGGAVIFLVSLAAGAIFYQYAQKNQTYTASSVLEYTYEGAEQGLDPNGNELDTGEIFAPGVVSKALAELGMDASADSVREKSQVTAVIPDDVQASLEAKIDSGQEYEAYHPTQFQVTFAASGEDGPEYAREVLDEILDQYLVFFGQRYISEATAANQWINAGSSRYDYIEQAEIMKDAVAAVQEQLEDKGSDSPKFRSAETGYSFADLKAQFDFIQQEKVPGLYARIIHSGVTKDADLLVSGYAQRFTELEEEKSVAEEKAASVQEIIDTYTEKNREGTLYYRGASGQMADSSGDILGNIYSEETKGTESGQMVDQTTVYDQLIRDYVALKKEQNNSDMEIEYCEMLLEAFSQERKGGTREETEALEKEVKEIIAELERLYGLLEQTMEEYNEYQGAEAVAILTSTKVSERFNVKLYAVLGAALFFLLGCAGAVVLGRLRDFAAYFAEKKRQENQDSSI